MQVFESWQTNSWSCLLDSGKNEDIGKGFSIAVREPVLTFQCKHGVQKLRGAWSRKFQDITGTQSPYKTLEGIQNRFSEQIDIPKSLSDVAETLPFLIGAVTLFAYDQNIESDRITDDDPNEYLIPDIAVGFFTESVIYDHANKCIFICTCSEKEEIKLTSCFAKCELPSYKTVDMKNRNEKAFRLLSPWKSNLNSSQYAKGFQRIKEYLSAGDCYQVNFAQRFSAQYTGSEWEAYKKLCDNNNAPFSAFMRIGESCVISVSPERFLKVNAQQVETKPIKGTRKRSSDPLKDAELADSLICSEKDRAENLMIVDLLRNDLSKHCQSHSVEVPKLFALESYPAVHHMVSTVVGKLKDNSSLYDLIEGAFPGGSITGAPKVRAMQVIQELEPNKRAIYCGSVGYIGIRNDMDTNICIRTLLTENNNIYCWAGGGIVIDSQVDDEYQESLDKVAKILPLLEESELDCSLDKRKGEANIRSKVKEKGFLDSTRKSAVSNE